MTYRDPQYLFGKISISLANTILIHRTSRIFDISYDLSKWPHLHKAYVINGCIFFWLAVQYSFSILVFVSEVFITFNKNHIQRKFLHYPLETQFLSLKSINIFGSGPLFLSLVTREKGQPTRYALVVSRGKMHFPCNF